mmetsp:Transcript_21048/g.58801  ORF Transcript_21048/g.58801 Transcript_21048/m.58801 type:complete len:202 (+) Transcript_21048:353-958(+)
MASSSKLRRDDEALSPSGVLRKPIPYNRFSAALGLGWPRWDRVHCGRVHQINTAFQDSKVKHALAQLAPGRVEVRTAPALRPETHLRYDNIASTEPLVLDAIHLVHDRIGRSTRTWRWGCASLPGICGLACKQRTREPRAADASDLVQHLSAANIRRYPVDWRATTACRIQSAIGVPASLETSLTASRMARPTACTKYGKS